MDFNSVLSIAQSNSRTTNGNAGRGYNPGASGQKVSGKKSTVESDVVKAFLDRKKREEQIKAIEADRRKRELLDLRSAARNNRKANAMARRTKDNNFMAYLSITEQLERDAANNHHGEHVPARKPVSNGNSSQKSLQKSLRSDPVVETKPEKKPPRPPHPPAAALNYGDLLSMASSIKNQVVDLPRIPKKKTVVDADIQGRLMTNDEKRKFIEEQARKQGRSLSSVALPPPSGRGPRYRGEEKNIVVESLTGMSPPAHKEIQKETSQKGASQGVRNPVKRPAANTQANSQPKVVPKSSCQRQASVPQQKGVAPARDRDSCRNVNVSKTAPNTQAKAQPPPAASKNQTRSPIVKNDKRPSVSQQAPHNNHAKLSTVKTEKPASNGMSMGNSNKSKPMTANMQQRVEKQMPPTKNIRNALPASKSVSSVPVQQPPPRQHPTGPNTKVNLPRGIPPRQPIQQQQRPINPTKMPPQPSASRPPCPPRDQQLRGPPLKDISARRPPATGPQDTLSRRLPPQSQEMLNRRPPPPQSQEMLNRRPPPPPPQSQNVLARRQPPQHQDMLTRRPPQPQDTLTRRPPPYPPSRDMMARRPPGDMSNRRPLPPHMRPPMKRRIESDAEDEYDEEMDDFIDDGPVDGGDFDYSTHIKQIFGYDRARYVNEGDDEIMESSFAQQMKEEALSTRLGILEDLEDIQREQDELDRSRKKRKRVKK